MAHPTIPLPDNLTGCPVRDAGTMVTDLLGQYSGWLAGPLLDRLEGQETIAANRRGLVGGFDRCPTSRRGIAARGLSVEDAVDQLMDWAQTWRYEF